MDATLFTSHMRKFLLLMAFLLGFAAQVSAVRQLTIGQAETVYLNPSLPADAWITSAGWSTDKVGLNYFDGGTWGTGIRVDGYWSGTATLSCFYSYSYYGIDGNIHVGSGNEYWYFTCQGYPVSITPTDVTLDKGETASLKFSITGASIGKLPAVWESSDKSVATVYSTGDYTASVRAKSPGSCTITCYSYMGEPVVCNVTVNSFPPTSISLSPSEAEITEGESVTIKCTLSPSGASSKLTWKSDDNLIATVKNGKVTAVSLGRTTIRVTTENGLTASSEITVVEKFVNPRGPVSSSLNGSGTANDPFLITSAADLRYLSDMVNSGYDYANKYFKQTQDIVINTALFSDDDFTKEEIWRPIGTRGTPFCGVYDGANHVISGIYCESELMGSTKYFGLFGAISKNSCLRNIKLKNILIHSSTFGFIGGLVGIIDNGNNNIIENCHIQDGYLHGTSVVSVGGIIGDITSTKGEIKNCSNSTSIKGSDVGGIVRCAYGTGYILNCINKGDITANSFAGGIAMMANYNIYNCCNAGNITGSSRVCGIVDHVGENGSHYICHCVNYGDLKSRGGKVAAIFNSNNYSKRKIYLQENFYLSKFRLTNGSYVTAKNNHRLSETNMKSPETLADLNESNESSYSRWVADLNGYPVFDWALALYTGVEDIKENEPKYDNFFCLPNDTMVSLYSTQGQLLYKGTKGKLPQLNSGIFLVVCNKGTYKVKL